MRKDNHRSSEQLRGCPNLNTHMSTVYHLERRQIIPIAREEAWAYFATPRNLEEMTPPSLSFRIQWGGDEPMHAGQLIGYRVKVAPFTWVNWLTEITVVEPLHAFVDEQRRGPYRLWHHLHRFTTVPGGTECLDRVRYQLPLGICGNVMHGLWIKRQLSHIFAFRAQHLVRRFGPAPVK
jgi:ligand-binding SRPBCC domain-containing protein